MKGIGEVLKNHLSVRVTLLAALLVIVVVVAAPDWLREELDWRLSALALKGAYALGVLMPALLLGAVIGWLAYSKRAWAISTAIFIAATGLLFYFARDLAFEEDNVVDASEPPAPVSIPEGAFKPGRGNRLGAE